MNDLNYMEEAYKKTLIAFEKGAYPVGAILVQNDEIISKISNICNSIFDPTAYA